MKNYSPCLYLGIFGCIWLPNIMQVSFCSRLTSQRRSILINNSSSPGVQLREADSKHVVIDNGIVEVTLSKPKGFVTGVKYKGINNVLDIQDSEDNRGYWDVVWYKPGRVDIFDRMEGTNYTVIMADENQVEVSFTRRWDVSIDSNIVPLNIDKRFIMRRGSSGFYAYAILERLEGWPDVNMDQIRIVFKLQTNKFNYMAISDKKQRIMPTLEDRARGQPLAYPEAVLLTHPSNPQLTGEVDDKYEYSMEHKESKLYGWISDDKSVGFWMIRPSDEFCNGGPIKQDLTSHAGPIVLSMFTSTHYGGKDINTQYRKEEQWKKVFGPVFIYLNSNRANGAYKTLWKDAKRQMSIEVESWPYDFPQSKDFPHSNNRATVEGQLIIHDEGVSKLASSAHVGLAAPGDAGSWQFESKGYQFWTRANKKGFFSIKNVRAGIYNLYAWVPGFIGNYMYKWRISIKQGSKIILGVLKYIPPRNGPTLWEIGIPNRSATEFFIPDPKPTLENKLFINKPHDKFRQYGLWDRYSNLFPSNDLIYHVGKGNYTQDWFFAHVPSKCNRYSALVLRHFLPSDDHLIPSGATWTRSQASWSCCPTELTDIRGQGPTCRFASNPACRDKS
ncbi:hypothetical protein MANES_13G102600v8 [Manihot esculenta]|uniref:Uncharacterized protein n=1 Tax=Manihot esculenta TaxID=3983 RepID=A0ACB7GLI6_MANES|nr:hypothetical protein MANES_13G102600v8 [Manihot esculenta]